MDNAPPVILPANVEALIKKLDHNKAPGEDKITGGVLQDGGEAIFNLLTPPNSDIKNYRPINLLPIINKVFSCILLQWILWTVDFHQPREQAGFSTDFSMIDHLNVVNQPQEKVHIYNIPLCFVFVDYEKAFDSIEFKPIFHALKNHGVNKA